MSPPTSSSGALVSRIPLAIARYMSPGARADRITLALARGRGRRAHLNYSRQALGKLGRESFVVWTCEAIVSMCRRCVCTGTARARSARVALASTVARSVAARLRAVRLYLCGGRVYESSERTTPPREPGQNPSEPLSLSLSTRLAAFSSSLCLPPSLSPSPWLRAFRPCASARARVYLYPIGVPFRASFAPAERLVLWRRFGRVPGLRPPPGAAHAK